MQPPRLSWWLFVFLYEEAKEAFTELDASSIKLYGYVSRFCATALSGGRVVFIADATVLMGELLSILAGKEGSILFVILVQASLNSLSII